MSVKISLITEQTDFYISVKYCVGLYLLSFFSILNGLNVSDVTNDGDIIVLNG